MLSIKKLVLIGIITALYVALTLVLAPLSFGNIQIRLSEILNLFTVFNPVYGVAVVLGVFISNLLASPYGLIDVCVGSISTAIAVYIIHRTRSNLLLSSIWPTLLSSCIGIMLYYVETELAGISIILICVSVMIGEFITLTIIALPIVRYINSNKNLLNIFSFNEKG